MVCFATLDACASFGEFCDEFDALCLTSRECWAWLTELKVAEACVRE